MSSSDRETGKIKRTKLFHLSFGSIWHLSEATFPFLLKRKTRCLVWICCTAVRRSVFQWGLCPVWGDGGGGEESAMLAVRFHCSLNSWEAGCLAWAFKVPQYEGLWAGLPNPTKALVISPEASFTKRGLCFCLFFLDARILSVWDGRSTEVLIRTIGLFVNFC